MGGASKVTYVKKKKKYRLTAKFYCWIFLFGIIGVLSVNLNHFINSQTIPNFHGWTAEEVMEYDEKNENITVIYDLVYSYDILQNRVMDQSIKPRTMIGKDPLVITVTVSKGAPVMEDFTGESVTRLIDFANEHNVTVVSDHESSARHLGIVTSQSILMGEMLKKDAKIKITLE